MGEDFKMLIEFCVVERSGRDQIRHERRRDAAHGAPHIGLGIGFVDVLMTWQASLRPDVSVLRFGCLVVVSRADGLVQRECQAKNAKQTPRRSRDDR